MIWEQMNCEAILKHETYREFNKKTCDMILTEARALAIKELLPLMAEGDAEGVKFEAGDVKVPESFHRVYRLILEGEWNNLGVSQEMGGQGAPAFIGAAAAEYFVGANWPLYCYATMGNGTAYIINLFGTPEQKEKYVKKLTSAEWGGTMLLTESEAGSDVAGLKTRAVKEGDDYVLNGTKTFISNGNVADIIICMARTGEPGHKGISNFIVETKTPGCQASKPFRKLGNRASPTCEVVFTDCQVSALNLLGTEDNGFIETMNFFPFERVFVAVASGALGESSYYEALKYAQDRKQFNKSISQFQMVQQMLADMACDIQAIKAITKDCLLKYASGIQANTEASIAKLFASETIMKVTMNAIQILGGYGYTREFPVERWFRDARAYSIGGGTSQIQRRIIAKAMMK